MKISKFKLKKEEFKDKETLHYPYNAIINVTDACNLRCKYCFTEHHPHFMDLDIAKKTVDWLYNNKKKQEELQNRKIKSCELYFFGGEPMLCYDSIIIPIVNYCNEKYPEEFSFGLTTNGTLLNKENIDFFKLHHFKILYSFDGNRTTQEYNRPCADSKKSSYDLAIKNLPYLLEQFPYVCCRETIDPDTVTELFNNYLEAEKLGFKSIAMIENIRGNWTTEKINILEQEMAKIYAYRLKQFLNGEFRLYWEVGQRWLRFTTILCDTDKHQESYINYKFRGTFLRCGLGTASIAIGYDGTLLGCQEWSTRDDKDIFEIGNINTGIDKEKHNKLLKTYYDESFILLENMPKESQCTNCFGKKICSQAMTSCPSAIYDIYHQMHFMPDITCKMRQIYYKNSLMILKILLDLNNEEINIQLKEYLKEY